MCLSRAMASGTRQHMWIRIQSSVGKGCVNRLEDIATIQELLNLTLRPSENRLVVDGSLGPKTIAAIETFQARVAKLPKPDGRVDPSGRTFVALINSTQVAVSRLTQFPT